MVDFDVSVDSIRKLTDTSKSNSMFGISVITVLDH